MAYYLLVCLSAHVVPPLHVLYLDTICANVKILCLVSCSLSICLVQKKVSGEDISLKLPLICNTTLLLL